MSVHELALQRNKYKHLSDDEWRWFLQQVEGRERTADKLPTFASIPDWWYPVRLSCEQCSSELTARYKASLVSGEKMADLTAGYGVDTYFLSERFTSADYVEQNAELCRIAEHNFKQPTPSLSKGKEICVHNTTAEEFLHQITNQKSQITNQKSGYDLIFADPARRDSHGGKVFRLEDCTPNIVELLPTLLEHLTPDGRIMLKLSPMLDLTQALKALTPYTLHRTPLQWDIHIVAVKNEVKEVLLLSGGNSTITAIDLDKKDQAFVFTKEEEKNAPSSFHLSSFTFLYEPSASILKAGAYKLVAQRFNLHKLDVNTHLYASEILVENFPGRVFKALPFKEGMGLGSQANVICRNYPLSAEQLKKKLHLRDGGTAFVIGCRVAGKPTLFYAERIL